MGIEQILPSYIAELPNLSFDQSRKILLIFFTRFVIFINLGLIAALNKAELSTSVLC